MRFLKLTAFALCSMLSFSFTSCSDDDNDNNENILGNSKLWGDVLRGDNMTLQFYPDHFAYYWEYTFDAKANPDLGLIIEGEYPDARFLSYNVYDDDSQTSNCEQSYSLMDIEITPDNGYTNPFCNETSAKNQKYTVYILPTDAPASITANKSNICWFDADVEKVCTILRYYIPEGDMLGGVAMPTIKGIDLSTGKEVNAPKRELSGLRGEMELPSAAFTSTPTLLFFRAPFSYAYPNGPAEYCYSRNILDENEVMLFNFKAPTYPKTVGEYTTCDMRYWSVCVGNSETYTPLAISDYQTKIDSNGFANYILADKNSADYSNVKALAEANGYNILEWNGKEWKQGVMILYRNMVFADDYAHSLRNMLPVGPDVDQMDILKNPQKYICGYGLGQWGAIGKKITTTEFIEANGNITLR